MAYRLLTTHQFEKDVKRCRKRGLPMDKLKEVTMQLAESGHVPPSHKPHLSHGNRNGQWECHIRPDWLSAGEQKDRELTLQTQNTESHLDIFDKRKR